jgi:hypothetical protein
MDVHSKQKLDIAHVFDGKLLFDLVFKDQGIGPDDCQIVNMSKDPCHGFSRLFDSPENTPVFHQDVEVNAI